MQCPVCEHPDTLPKWELTDRLFRLTTERFTFFECSGCGLLFQDARAVENRTAELYPDSYWWEEDGSPLSRLEGFYRSRLLAFDHLRFLRSLFPVPEGRRLIDIGCGSGLFVGSACRLGFQAYGLETSVRAVEAAHRMGNGSVELGTVEDVAQSGRRFEIVTLFHCLEHVVDPFRFLRQVQKILAKPGHLVVQVPNRNSLQAKLYGRRWYGFDCPRHICNFSLFALLSVLGRAGFRIQRLKHFSLRDNAPAIVSSLVPGLDPLARRVSSDGTSVVASFLGSLVYLAAVVAAQPLALVEAALGRGGTVTVHATWE